MDTGALLTLLRDSSMDSELILKAVKHITSGVQDFQKCMEKLVEGLAQQPAEKARALPAQGTSRCVRPMSHSAKMRKRMLMYVTSRQYAGIC